MNGKNMKWLGLLGLLGLLGFATHNYGFFGFFGFFAFFAAAQRSDERLEINAYKAGFNSFVVSLIGLALLITALSMQTGLALVSIIIAIVFIAAILTYVLSMLVLEKKGGK